VTFFDMMMGVAFLGLVLFFVPSLLVIITAPLRMVVYLVLWIWCKLTGKMFEQEVWW
jgi:hypothetical protein